MPQQGTQTFKIIVAQAEHGSDINAEGHGAAGETHAAAGHGGGEHTQNPLAHHSSWYFTAMGAIVVVVLVSLAVAATRGLTRIPRGKMQSLAEVAVEGLGNFTRQAIGPGGERFTPLVATIFLFVLFSNLLGVLPSVFGRTGDGVGHLLPAPTANLSMTIALALVVFITVQGAGIRANGVGGHLKHLAGPVPALSPLMFPLELIGEIAKPLSLSIRLFGNIFGEETVIAVLVGLAVSALPLFLPIPFQFPMLLFGIFTALVQAGVFTILTCAYISLSLGEHSEHAEHHDETHEEQLFAREAVVP